MVEALPIGPDGIHRAAEEMIAEHGPEALAEAKKQAQTHRSEGFESVAKTWDLICTVILDLDEYSAHGEGEIEALVLSPRVAELAVRMPRKEPPDLSRFLLSPMPGLLVSLAVAPGQEVKAGEELAVVEAMKMQNMLRAERDGVIAELHAEPGASLAVDQAILEFE
jgi:acetyl/propionyl-CoA carboxylase alpha subunit